jgi:AcrR family transcriptional regulator
VPARDGGSILTRRDTEFDEGSATPPTGRRLMRKHERRAQLIRAAAQAFLEGGFAATTLEDVAAHAGVTKVIIYRHFDSKRDLYHAVLVDTRERTLARIGGPEQFGAHTVHNLALAARENPDGFRLFYRHASREPDFADYVDEISRTAARNAESRLHELIPDPQRRAWIARLLPTLTVDAILTWLDAGQPVDIDGLTQTIGATMHTITTTVPTLKGGPRDVSG